MTHWDMGLLVGILVVGATVARGAEDARAAILLEARELRDARKDGLRAPVAGTWHAWAWQRGGKEVTWEIGGAKLGPAKAEGDADHFAWVRLGTVELPADRPFPIAFEPSVIGPKRGAVAAVCLATHADCDPKRFWQLTRVYPDTAEAVADARPATCHHLNERFTMPDYKTKADWERRAAWLRDHIRVSCGLLPEPERTPLKAQAFDRIERDGYTIEKAFIESYPGFYCTGNLYRPRGKDGPFPAVACPHGHWPQGRFGHEEPKGSVPARCITLARLGYVVFSYDMVGYNDSGKQTGGHRGVFASPHNELWGLSLMHLQSWNTIRVLDWLQSLPDVDPKRLGLTGCSGGGTQTFMVMGIEPRVTAAAPVNMISGTMQGGCECENAPLLRIDTCNIEIGALMAPRPLILCSVTGDWTKETPKHEYPKIRSIYELCGVADRVLNVHDEAPHGYNKTHRQAVYTFFRRWVQGIADGQKVEEPPYEVEKKEDLLVFGNRALPEDAKTPATLKAHVVAECQRQRDELLPKEAEDLPRFRDTLGVAFRHAILAELPEASDITVRKLGVATEGNAQITRLVLGRRGGGDQVPALLYSPTIITGRVSASLVVHPQGKAALLDLATARPGKLLESLLQPNHMVLLIDPYLTGGFHSPFARTRQAKPHGFFSTYNRTELVQRVQDILTGLGFLRQHAEPSRTALVGTGEAGAWCLLAAPFAPEGVRVVADLAQIGGDDDPRWLTDLFTPCILKAGGLWTAVALAAPRRLFLHNVAEGFDTGPVAAAYRAANASERLRIERRPADPTALTRWLAER